MAYLIHKFYFKMINIERGGQLSAHETIDKMM